MAAVTRDEQITRLDVLRKAMTDYQMASATLADIEDRYKGAKLAVDNAKAALTKARYRLDATLVDPEALGGKDG